MKLFFKIMLFILIQILIIAIILGVIYSVYIGKIDMPDRYNSIDSTVKIEDYLSSRAGQSINQFVDDEGVNPISFQITQEDLDTALISVMKDMNDGTNNFLTKIDGKISKDNQWIDKPSEKLRKKFIAAEFLKDGQIKVIFAFKLSSVPVLGSIETYADLTFKLDEDASFENKKLLFKLNKARLGRGSIPKSILTKIINKINPNLEETENNINSKLPKGIDIDLKQYVLSLDFKEILIDQLNKQISKAENEKFKSSVLMKWGIENDYIIS